MATFTSREISRNGEVAALPSAKRAQTGQGRGSRIARRLASVPGSLYSWVSGPPMTSMERERATLAYARNGRGRGTILV